MAHVGAIAFAPYGQLAEYYIPLAKQQLVDGNVAAMHSGSNGQTTSDAFGQAESSEKILH